MNKRKKPRRLSDKQLRDKLVFYPDPILEKPCTHTLVEEADKIVQELMAVAFAVPNCLGLAANQIGHNKQVIVFRKDLVSSFAYLVNPVIVNSEDPQTAMEMCLSYPGRRKLVRAFNKIGVVDTHGAEKYTGVAARVIQHEMKHLAGKCPVK